MMAYFVWFLVLFGMGSPQFDELILRSGDHGVIVLNQCNVAYPVSVGEMLCSELGGVLGLGRVGGRVGGGGGGMAGEIEVQVPGTQDAVAASGVAVLEARLDKAGQVQFAIGNVPTSRDCWSVGAWKGGSVKSTKEGTA